MNTYDYGDIVKLTATFRNNLAALTTPSVTVCKVKAPDGAITQPTITLGGPGVVESSIAVNQEGEWNYRFEGTTPTCAVEGRFIVRNSAFY